MTALRPGGPADLDAVLALFDANVAWLAARGREGQWGSEPWSPDPGRRAFVAEILANGETTVAEVDGRVAGALVVAASTPAYLEPPGEPELYVYLLIADPALRGAGVGAALLARAPARAAELGIDLVRVDCWAGGDGRLIAYYEAQGYAPTTTFTSGTFTGQVLQRRLSAPPT